MKSLQEKFGTRVREIRRSKNFTQEYLAELLDMDIPNLSNIERGKKFVSGQTISKLARALEVDEKDLFNFNHIKTKKELVILIENIIRNADEKELEYYYRMMKMFKEVSS